MKLRRGQGGRQSLNNNMLALRVVVKGNVIVRLRQRRRNTNLNTTFITVPVDIVIGIVLFCNLSHKARRSSGQPHQTQCRCLICHRWMPPRRRRGSRSNAAAGGLAGEDTQMSFRLTSASNGQAVGACLSLSQWHKGQKSFPASNCINRFLTPLMLKLASHS